jgi:flavin-dependent dehydrogenase
MRIESGTPVAHVLERQRLNELCREQAERAGATVITQRRITPERLDTINRGGSIIIGADGAVSTVAAHFRMGPLADYVITYKAEFHVRLDDARNVDLFFDREYRGLFGWLCPNSDEILEAGIGVRHGRMNARRAFDRFMERREVAEAVGNARMHSGQASIIPMRLRRRIVDEKRKVLLVGDAAGQVKPSTGGGIVFGGNGAIMAARAIQGHLERGKSLMEYETSYKKRFAADTRVHSMINKLYTRSGTKGMELGIRIMNAIGMASLLGKYGDMDSPTKTMMNVFSGKQRVTE